MIGIVVELILSWLLLWFLCRKHLSVLGFAPTGSRRQDFAAGLFGAAVLCCVYYLLQMLGGSRWGFNGNVTAKGLVAAAWWMVISVLYEELIFRGAPLYIAIRKWGEAKACLLSAACFGVYHWFSYNAFGNPVPMVYVFLLTGFTGWALARAFAKTGSLYLPVALHLGWNLVAGAVLSNGPLGRQLLLKAGGHQPQGGLSLLIFLFQLLALPLFTLWYLKGSAKRSKTRN